MYHIDSVTRIYFGTLFYDPVVLIPYYHPGRRSQNENTPQYVTLSVGHLCTRTLCV